MSSQSEYTLQLFTGGLSPHWQDVLLFDGDQAAVAEACELLSRYVQTRAIREEIVSILVGRGRGDVEWLGAWHWNEAPEWMPI